MSSKTETDLDQADADGSEEVVKPAPAKKQAEFFAAIRSRGLLNAMLDAPALAFEAANPGWRARWEYAPPNGDQMMVVGREGQGFRVVDASELGEHTASERGTGLVRRGDLILMAGPVEIVNQLEIEDAKRAYEDYKLPETSYRQHLQDIQVRRKDGTVEYGRPVGQIRRTVEKVEMPAAGTTGG